MDAGNFVNQKELDYESFQKSSLLNFPPQAVTITAVNEHTYGVLQRQRNKLPLVCIFQCLM